MKLIYFLLISGTVTMSAYADESKTFVIDDFIVTSNNTLVSDISLTWDSKDLDLGTIMFSKSMTGTLEIKIPKEMSRITNLSFGPINLFAVQQDRSTPEIIKSESNCFYILSIPVYESDYVEIIGATLATGKLVSESIQDDACKQDKNKLNSEIILHKNSLKQQVEEGLSFNEILCPNDNHVLAERPNGKLACVYENTVKKLKWEVRD